MMKRTKKILSVIMSLMMIMSMFAGLEISSFAETDIEDGLYFEVSEDEGIAAITGYDAESISSSLYIPSELGGYPVTTIADSAFFGCEEIVTVEFPYSLTTIGKEAFRGCSNLQELYVNDSLEYIGWGAFRNCTSLVSVYIPDSVTKIEANAFACCSSLESAFLSSSITEISPFLFEACPKLAYIEIPNGVTTIGGMAFAGCSSLDSMEIPVSVNEISYNAFFDCESLKYVVIFSNVNSIGEMAFGYLQTNSGDVLADEFVMAGISGSATESYANENNIEFIALRDVGETGEISGLYYKIVEGGVAITGYDSEKIEEDVVIPDTVDWYTVIGIGDGAFDGCEKLVSIELSYKITSIGTDAFYNCVNLEYVGMPENVTELGDYVFQNCHKIRDISLPYGITEITNGMFVRCYALESIEIPSTVEEIGDIAFMACNSLTEVTIPWSVIEIGAGAFQECESLTSVTIEYGVETIYASAFYDCPGFENVVIPESVTSIGQYAFGYAKNPDSIDVIDGFVIKGFADSAAETYANENGIEFVLVDDESGDDEGGYDNPSENWDEYGDFYYEIIDGEVVIRGYNGDSKNKEVDIPAYINDCPVTSIGEYAFMCSEIIEYVTIPSTVKKISNGAFLGCVNMKSVEIPDSVGTIGGEAFFDCRSLKEVVIPDSVIYIAGWAFAVCLSLEKVVLSSGLTAICEGTFFDCQSLYDIGIPGSVESIGEAAFENCISLNNIKIPDSVTEIRDMSLGYGNNGESLALIDGFTITGKPGTAAETYANKHGIEFIAIGGENPTDPSAFMYEIKNGEVTITGINGFLGNNVVIPNTIEGYPVTAIGEMAFAECTDIIYLYIPDSVKEIGSYAFYYCAFLESVKLPAGLTVLNEGVFSTCLKLATVKIPDSVTTIGTGAFHTCTSLAQVNIPGNVTTIEDYAFYKTGSLKTLTIGGSVETIGNNAFTYSGIESVIIPDGVTTIGEHAFEACDYLSSATIAESVTSIGEMAFGFNEDWELVDGFVINGYAGSAAETYANANGIGFVAISNNENAVPGYLTYEINNGEVTITNCDQFYAGKVAIPDTIEGYPVTEIAAGAFYCCYDVTEVVLPEGLKKIREEAFVDCGIKSIEIPASVTEFGTFSVGYIVDKYGYCEVNKDFCIMAEKGSAAETYANENGIKFVVLGNNEPVESDKLVSDDENIQIDNDKKLSTFEPGRTAKDIADSISNNNFAIKDKDGNAVADDALVGTGSKIQILDNDGNVVSEYEVVVPADVDGNGEITASDARKALRASAGMDEIDGVYKTAADSDNNSELTASDARKILRKSAGLE